MNIQNKVYFIILDSFCDIGSLDSIMKN